MALTRTELSTTDLDEMRELFSRAYADQLTARGVPGQPFFFEQVAATDGTVTVSTLRFVGRITAKMAGSREVVLTDIAEGRYDWASGGIRGDQDRPLILPAKHELSVDFESTRSVGVTVNAATVTRWLARWGGLPPSPALLHQPAAGSEAVRHTLRYYAQVMPTETFENDLIRASLFDVLMSVTAHHLLPEVRSAQRPPAPAALRRAEDYFHEHATEAISIVDAAEAARLSIRTLQDQFQKWLGMTPGQYLRNIRLDGARADLVSARAEGRPERVGDVAQRWGFVHRGRFAEWYADAFGEQPRATLGR